MLVEYRMPLLESRLCVLGHDLTLRDAIARLWDKRFVIARFLASGCSAAGVHFTLLFIFTHYAGLHYLLSSTLAFTVAVTVGFTMQKFWTFANSSMDSVHKQAIQYVTLGLMNMGINAAMMYVLVDTCHLWYMLAQFLVCGFLAFSNFIIYHLFIFRTEPARS